VAGTTTNTGTLTAENGAIFATGITNSGSIKMASSTVGKDVTNLSEGSFSVQTSLIGGNITNSGTANVSSASWVIGNVTNNGNADVSGSVVNGTTTNTGTFTAEDG
ncbi:hypothetical protein, partial [Komagataeibacter europaeus]|uniref:hypothetical protein n=1 Tax=Komagataeibacter europaeus TaxID=33995 RepID=UPI000AAA88CA